MSDPTLGALCALGAALAWSVTSLLARSLLTHYGSVTINAVRSGVAGILLVAWVSATTGPGVLVTMSGATFALLAVSIVAAIAVGDTVFFESTRAIGLGRGIRWNTLMIRVGGALVTLYALIQAFLTLIGSPGLTWPQRLWFGVWTAVLASVAWAVSTAMMKPPLREIEPLTAQAIRLPLASALLWLTPWTRGAAAALRDGGRGPLLRFAALSVITAGSSVLFVASLKYAGVAVGSVLSATAPLFAIPLGVIFLGERLSVATVLGALLAVAGIVVLQL